MLLPGPATLWGILLSESNGVPRGSELDEVDNDTQSIDSVREQPSVLWPISLPDALTPENCELLDRDASIELWLAAGYDCESSTKEEVASSPPGSDSWFIAHEASLPTAPTPSPTGPYVVRESPGKGLGVFAARKIIKGERILVDKPFLVVTKPYTDKKVLHEFERLPLVSRQQYMQLYCPDRRDDICMTDVMSIFQANCFNIGESAAVFQTATRFNHSCLPNTYYSWNRTREEIVFHSMSDLPQGEEMTICYGNPFLTRLQRRAELHIYNFCCHCPSCQPETAFGRASEERRFEMKQLEEQITMFLCMPDKARLVYGLRDPLTAIFRLIELIKAEGLKGELMTPYHSVAEYLKGRGNFEEALVFARKEMELEVTFLGLEHEVIGKTEEFVQGIERLRQEAEGETMEDENETVKLETELDLEEEEDDDEEGNELDAIFQEEESAFETQLPPPSRTGGHDDSHERNTDTRESSSLQQPDDPASLAVEPTREPSKEPGEKEPSTPTENIEDLAHRPGLETVDDGYDYDNSATNEYPPIPSQSSSPRLVRKK